MRYLIIVLGLLLIPSAASAQDVSPRCEAAMDRAAGDYSQCLLRADAHYARHENATKLKNRQTRCETRFDRRTSRAIRHHGADACPSSDLVAAMEDRTVTYAQGAAIEAGGEAALSRLYVQDATGGTLTETTLVLSGIDESTPWFTDRPYREAGQITTAEFVELFSEEGANSFAENPPNADFTCESGGEVVNQAVTLTDPVFDETAGTLTYTAELLPTAGDDDFFAGITCDADAHLFIDDEAKARNWAYKMIGYRDGCYAAGGTWEPEKNKCIERYNCFIGGFCAELASLGYVSAARGNLYDGDKPGTPPASDAGCNESQGAIGWANGKLAANNPDRRIGMGPVCGCTYDPVDEPVVLYPCANN